MVVVVPDTLEVEDLHRTLRQGGYILRSSPGGVFELIRLHHGLSTCDLCEKPASIATNSASLCSVHALEKTNG